MPIIQVNTEDQLYSAIDKELGRSKVKKIRVMEYGESYEDYSMSYTLPPQSKRIDNYTVSIEDGKVIICKKAKGSTRHVCFAVGSKVEVVYVDKKIPYIKVSVLNEVRYTDGTHRYVKQ